MLSRIGKIWGACLKTNNAHEPPSVFPNVRVPPRLLLRTWSWQTVMFTAASGSSVGPRAAQKEQNGKQWGRGSLPRSTIYPLRRRRAWMGHLDSSFPYSVNVFHRPAFLLKFTWVSFSLAGWKPGHNLKRSMQKYIKVYFLMIVRVTSISKLYIFFC